jgi:hypothetical protein
MHWMGGVGDFDNSDFSDPKPSYMSDELNEVLQFYAAWVFPGYASRQGTALREKYSELEN